MPTHNLFVTYKHTAMAFRRIWSMVAIWQYITVYMFTCKLCSFSPAFAPRFSRRTSAVRSQTLMWQRCAALSASAALARTKTTTTTLCSNRAYATHILSVATVLSLLLDAKRRTYALCTRSRHVSCSVLRGEHALLLIACKCVFVSCGVSLYTFTRISTPTPA